MYPYLFKPILKQTIWGGSKIIPFKNLSEDLNNVGESWEISGVSGSESIVANGPDAGLTLTQLVREYKGDLVGDDNYAQYHDKFPLLIKFIDAKQDLSIQVHPDDEMAKLHHDSLGKTEMWYIIDAEKDSSINLGFSQEITPKEYKQRIHNHSILEVLKNHKIKKGDVFFIPAGRVHSLGAGSFIAEIQQTSDVTYRIYDFDRKDAEGNPRELHTNLAAEALDYSVLDDYGTHYKSNKNEPVELVACPYFTTSLYEIDEDITCDYTELDSFMIFICMEGKCKMIDDQDNEITIEAGQTVLFPATTMEVTIIPEGEVKMLETYI